MKKYNEEYFSVIERRTGRKICDCAEWFDAIMMLDIDPNNRIIRRNKFLMSEVIDVEIPKALPTNEVVASGSWSQPEYASGNGPGQLPQIKLPEGQAAPVIF